MAWSPPPQRYVAPRIPTATTVDPDTASLQQVQQGLFGNLRAFHWAGHIDAGLFQTYTIGIPLPTTNAKPPNNQGLSFLILDEVLFTCDTTGNRPDFYAGLFKDTDAIGPATLTLDHCADRSNPSAPFADVRFGNMPTAQNEFNVPSLLKLVRSVILTTGGLQQTWRPNLLFAGGPDESTTVPVMLGIVISLPNVDGANPKTACSLSWREPSIR